MFTEQYLLDDDQQPKDIFFLLDEVPCNSDNGSFKLAWGKSSGDWRGLNSNGVHLMMALRPLGEGDTRGIFTGLADYILSKENLDLLFPTHLMQIKLRRMFRCTQSIGRFHEQVVKGIKMCYTNLSPNVNNNSISYIPGHEIYGDNPEILLLPKCASSYSLYVGMCLFHYTSINYGTGLVFFFFCFFFFFFFIGSCESEAGAASPVSAASVASAASCLAFFSFSSRSSLSTANLVSIVCFITLADD